MEHRRPLGGAAVTQWFYYFVYVAILRVGVEPAPESSVELRVVCLQDAGVWIVCHEVQGVI